MNILVPIRIESNTARDYEQFLRLPKRFQFGDGTNAWSEFELDMLRETYARAAVNTELKLAWLANKIGRDKPNVCRKARDLGLTDQQRPDGRVRKATRKFEDPAARKASIIAGGIAWRIANGHPRGALGMRHTPETKALISAKSAARWAEMSQVEREDHIYKAVKTKREMGINFANPRGSWKAAWREVGDQRCFFRSRWEANYARYLEWLRSIGQIAKWEHEPHTFWFEGIKRGCVSYLPDFRVTENSGAVQWHEVKGWMDARSKTTIARMAKYHPQEVLVVIREKQYNEIKLKVSTLIPGWEA